MYNYLFILIFIIIIHKFWKKFTLLKNHLSKNLININLKNLKILSWNIFLRSYGFISFYHNDFKNCRLKQIINYLKNYHIVFLQEAFITANFRIHYLLDQLYQYGFKYWVIPNNSSLFSLKFMDSGLIIISKIPLSNANEIIFNNGNNIDYYASKSFQTCDILINNKKIKLINTHCNANYQLFDDKYTWDIKKTQYKQIGDYLKNNNINNFILGGDFNCNYYHHHNYNIMLKLLNLKSYHNKIKNKITTKIYYYLDNFKEFNTYFYKYPKENNIILVPLTIDYFFTNFNNCYTNIKKFKSKSLPVKYLSDHYAIELNILFNK